MVVSIMLGGCEHTPHCRCEYSGRGVGIMRKVSADNAEDTLLLYKRDLDNIRK